VEKSTLLNILGVADTPTSGSVWIGDELVRFSHERMLVELRRRKLGYVFQHFNLLPTLTALENVMLPLVLIGEGDRTARDRALRILGRVGLGTRAAAFPHTMSGGEMQRVAIARAVVHRPVFVLADEPTGNLDSVSGERVLELLSELAQEGTTILMATHSEHAASKCSRIIRLLDGRMAS
jgi:putative ABC transport system ATP-binding protein